MTQITNDREDTDFSRMYTLKYKAIAGSIFALGVAIMFFFQQWPSTHILRDFGAFIAAAVASHILYEIALKREHEKILFKKLENLLNAENNLIKKSGIIGASEKLSGDPLLNSIGNAKRRVWILQSFIGDWTHLENSIKRALKNSVQVDILLLHPRSPHAISRSIECKKDKDWVSRGVRENLKNLSTIAVSDVGRLLNVKVYDGTAIFCIFGCDEEAFLGFMRREAYNINSTILKLNMHGETFSLSNDIKEHYDIIWESAFSIDFTNNNWRQI